MQDTAPHNLHQIIWKWLHLVLALAFPVLPQSKKIEAMKPNRVHHVPLYPT
jgi:hypothetical protein